MSKKLSCNLFILTGVLFFLPIMANGEIIYMDEAAEANSISVTFIPGTQTGTAKVTGCGACPLELSIDARTRFFQNNKSIDPRRKKSRSLSGKRGTVTYNKKEKRAVKILW